jgi:ABC-type polysaccharide/polyol phosphate transport system ATPase subunit
VNEPAIHLQGVGKRYVKFDDTPMLATRLRFRHTTKRSELWAVRGVDVEVQPGDCLGVIGRNGSGKSTLLQMLAGVTAPTEGTVSVRGRIAPLVSVGVGFHPELTGRENVYVNGTILGLSRAEIDSRFDSILDFAGIHSFIDTPVKFYSSGMYVRLGFAVAVEATPDVLLVDEVLAVGDMAFQLKCFRRMAEIRERGTTVVVVSHNLNAIRQLCDRALVLHDGVMHHDGDVDDGIGIYHSLLGEFSDPDSPDLRGGTQVENGVGAIESVELLDTDGGPLRHVNGGDVVDVRVRARFDRAVDRPVVGMAIIAGNGVNVYSESTATRPFRAVAAGERVSYRARLKMPLTTGSYNLRAGLYRVLDEFYAMSQLDESKPMPFFVSGRTGMGGLVDLAAEFSMDEALDDVR